MNEILTIENLTIRYGKVTAVNSLSLTVEEGQVFGFIGPNGAGKTSTMRVMATMLSPASGKVMVGGYDVEEEPREVCKLIGYMPDFFGVYEQLKVVEYLEFFGRLYSKNGDLKKRIDEVLELTGLSGKKGAYVEALSRGMKQRLCLARAILHRPLLLILDEPASGMDPQARIDIRKMIARLSQAGHTIFISSHILSELADICTHIGIIELGKLVGIGQVEEMLMKLRAKRLLIVKLGNLEKGMELLQKLAGVISVFRKPTSLEVEIEDRDEVAESLIRTLVGGGARPRSISEEKLDLEKLYLELTEGKVT